MNDMGDERVLVDGISRECADTGGRDTRRGAVTTWGHQLLVARANTLQRGVEPLLVQLRGDAAGTL
jgi:hypothetical protein